MPAPILDIIPDNPDPDDVRAIVATLDAYNNANSGMADLPGFAVIIRDPQTRAAVGGPMRRMAMDGRSSDISPSRTNIAARASGGD
ncbi:hypothetical protein [Sinorhizobium fredii]|uniref:hypothetical protein n=1 Tax=Rhizobium fredii TaxID=380 RepID=UPI00210D6121|nr:hypothetical protein [Sinorhizobium fredii]